MSSSNSTGPVLWSIDERGVASVILNRPEVNNAYDGGLVDGLLRATAALKDMADLRLIVIRGNGRHFQAGADLKWIDAVAKSSRAENISASRATAEAVRRLNFSSVPTLALVQGGCFGGGTGIIAACDVVIAADNAMFSISEVRWGLDRRDHPPPAHPRDRPSAVAPLRADRRTFRSRGGATHRPRP